MIICEGGGGLLLFHLNWNYIKGMSWVSWIGVGPLAYYFPAVPRMIANILKKKVTPGGSKEIN